MKNAFRLFCGVAFLSVASWGAKGEPQPNGVPPVNGIMAACIEGRAVRYINGGLSCAPATAAPTVTGCGTGPTISPNATDFSGVVSAGTGVVTACRINFSVAHVSPAFGCLTQAFGIALTSPSVDTTGITQNGVSLGGAVITYVCFSK